MMDDDGRELRKLKLAELETVKLELEIGKLKDQIRLREIGRSALVALTACIAMSVAAALVMTRLF